MKTHIVSSKQLAASNRWDAAFHIAIAEVEARVRHLQETKSHTDQVRIVLFLGGLKTDDLFYALAPLCTGRQLRRPTHEDLFEIVKRYPFESYALVERMFGDIQQRALAKMHAAEEYEAHVRKLIREGQ